jgi:hypothetical protein
MSACSHSGVAAALEAADMAFTKKQGGNRPVLIRSPIRRDIRDWLPYICV